MGCHTWVYKKFSALDEETQNDYIKKANDSFLKKYNQTYEEYCADCTDVAFIYINHSNDDTERTLWKDWVSDISCRKRFDEWHNKFDKFRDGITSSNIVDYCKHVKYPDNARIENGILYYEINFDTPFRLYGYPAETFTDFDALMDFLHRSMFNIKYTTYDNYGNAIENDVTENSWSLFYDHVYEYFKVNGVNDLFFKFG